MWWRLLRLLLVGRCSAWGLCWLRLTLVDSGWLRRSFLRAGFSLRLAATARCCWLRMNVVGSGAGGLLNRRGWNGRVLLLSSSGLCISAAAFWRRPTGAPSPAPPASPPPASCRSSSVPERIGRVASGKTEAPRTERVLPGIWRLRLPLPWPGVPHGNAWAVEHDGGVVMFDTGIGGKGKLRQLDLALAQAGFGVEDVRLVVCTHSHTDHYGLAGAICERAGCELWMHPNWEHVRLLADDPDAALEARIEVARQSGVSPAALERYREQRSDSETGIDILKEPDRDLVPGVEVETNLGTWQVVETPGHAPSHVVLHQPERRLLISGDHLLGRTVLFFDYGHSADPVGEFCASLGRVEPLEVDLVLPGHGRTFRDPEAKIAESRRQVNEL